MKDNEFEKNIDFSSQKTDIKPIALYLPQFHTFPENDEWWGRGFTEWTNVRKAKPLFPNHYEPRVPHPDFGYYDLSRVETLKRQVELAKQHGIYGFGIYYYWFSGKKLMEKPIDMLLEHTEIDFPFMLIWANENWTRTWDGLEKNVLIKQEYSADDPVNFIRDLKKYLDDPRYIRIDGKVVVGIYEPSLIPDVKECFDLWRKTARELGIGEIFILSCVAMGHAEKFGYENLVDAEYEFPPRDKFFGSTHVHANNGVSFSYENLIDNQREEVNQKLTLFRGSMLGWDNSARRQKNYHRWAGFSTEKFYVYNRVNVLWSRRHLAADRRFIFINAWNEWGEGTYLEPDTRYGYAPINALSRAIFDIPEKRGGEIQYTNLGMNGVEENWDADLKNGTLICVQAHVFYEELIAEIVGKTNNIPYGFDLFVTTTSEEKAKFIESYLKKHSLAKHFQVEIVENRGRDVIPFIAQLHAHSKKYRYFCHLHSKKSLYSGEGDVWRNYLFENLLGSSGVVREILHHFESDGKIGVVFPENIDFIRKNVEWGGDFELCTELMKKLKPGYRIDRKSLMFPAGNMFWGRFDALSQIFALDVRSLDVPAEENQRDGTIMHAIERIWLYLADANGFSFLQVRNLLDNRRLFPEQTFDESSFAEKKSRLYLFAKKLVHKLPHSRLIVLGLKSLKKDGLFKTLKLTLGKLKKHFSHPDRSMKKAWKNRHDFFISPKAFGLSEKFIRKSAKIEFPKNMTFSILVPLFNTPENFLKEMIASVLNQTYGKWELCLADGSDAEHGYVGKICEKIAKKDGRIKYRKLEKNGGISENTNECVKMATGDYISLFDHDDILHPCALSETIRAIRETGADFVYTDEAVFRSPDIHNISSATLKPDFVQEVFETCNYVCHFTSIKRSLFERVGFFRKEFDGAQDFDFFLRATEMAEKIEHIRKVLYFWRDSPASTAANAASKSYTSDAGRNALEAHFTRTGQKVTVMKNQTPNTFNLEFAETGKIVMFDPKRIFLERNEPIFGEEFFAEYNFGG